MTKTDQLKIILHTFDLCARDKLKIARLLISEVAAETCQEDLHKIRHSLAKEIIKIRGVDDK